MLSHASLVERFSRGSTHGSASHMFIENDVIYSYGHHFPLAVRGEWGSGIEYLVNGDRYSITTSQHQNLCIHALKPNVQVPFSALAAANLMLFRSTPDIQILAYQADEYHSTCKACGREVTYAEDADGHVDYYRHCHLDRSPLCPEAKGETVSHHVLGAVVIGYSGKCYLSSIDEAESWRIRAYFLCLLPRAVSTVDEAFASLVPNEVNDARSTGVEVRRQGDIFAIETTLLTREIRAATERHARLFETSHVASEARRVNGSVYVRGTLRHEPHFRRPQHAMLRLGRSWWKAAKNLAVASWNASGNVD